MSKIIDFDLVLISYEKDGFWFIFKVFCSTQQEIETRTQKKDIAPRNKSLEQYLTFSELFLDWSLRYLYQKIKVRKIDFHLRSSLFQLIRNRTKIKNLVSHISIFLIVTRINIWNEI